MVIIGQTSGKEILEAHFEISFNKDQEVTKQYRIGHQDESLVITCQKPHVFSTLNYGMVPFWSKERILHFEAPVDGGGEPHDEPGNIKKRIIPHPSYRRPIRETRCLIPVDYFILQSTHGEVYLLFSMQNRPFTLVGVYDGWKESYHEKDLYQGFSILTVPAGGKFKELGIERLPLLINPNRYKLWIKKEAVLTEITALMKLPAEKEINGYTINRKLFLSGSKEREIVRPAGDLIFAEEKIDRGKLAQYLRSFRYQKGLLHNKGGAEERIWRGSQ